MTNHDLCKVISFGLKEKFGIDIAPRDIWDLDSAGGLPHVWELYWVVYPEKAPIGVKPNGDYIFPSDSVTHKLAAPQRG